MTEKIEIDAHLVRVGDMIPGLGIVTDVHEVGQGHARRTVIGLDYCFTITAQQNCKITVERNL